MRVVVLLLLLVVCVALFANGEETEEERRASETAQERLKAEATAGLKRALTPEGIDEYWRLKKLGDYHRKRGEFTEAGQLYRKAIHLYTGALAVPYIKYSSFSHLGASILHKYASDRYVAPPDERTSFLEYELSKSTGVHAALERFTATLTKPHR